ncbi:RadC family protein [Halarcobacter anaerophilus]|uniref:RadC family protein n=1 Tax=Halarcobacter anaerophilus TaxID=877500 RepID=UPI0005C9A35C|nr:DNA repair protein RadC [Halarcobacter anaerophilus]
MKSITQLQSIDKPRERLFRYGLSALKNYELIAVLLGSGIQGKDVIKLSREIEKFFDSNFENIDLQKLLNIHGLGKAKASQIISAIELSKRYLLDIQSYKIDCALDVYEELKPYKNKKQEYFLTLYLDGANNLLETKIITIGTLNQSLVHPREVFSHAIEKRCASIIVAHNHPSGVLKPSSEDIKVTNRLKESGKILGIELLDHLIFTNEGFISLQEEGIL